MTTSYITGITPNILNLIKDLKDSKWISTQITQDLSTGLWTEKDFIEKVIKPGKIGWNHEVFQKLLKTQQEQDDYILNPFEAEEGVVQCHKCNSFKVFSIAVQTRAADEATTTMSQCTECNNKWSHN